MSNEALKIVTRNTNQRHTATLDNMLQYQRERAAIGMTLIGDIEIMLQFTELSAEQMRAELSKLVAQSKLDRKASFNSFHARGDVIDAYAFADEM